MDKYAIQKILDAQERFYKDPNYQDLQNELQVKSTAFQSLLEELPPRQRAVIDDYMGLLHEMQRKLLCYVAEN